MSLEPLTGLVGKFEKSELYTFITGCGVALSYMIMILTFKQATISNNSYLIIFLFVFLFLFFTGIIYALYLLIVNVIKLLIWCAWKNKKLKNRTIKKSKQYPIRYTPALNSIIELYHISLLVFCALLLMIPKISSIINIYIEVAWLKWVYYLLMFVSIAIVVYQHWALFILEECHKEGCFELTADYNVFIDKLNKARNKST